MGTLNASATPGKWNVVYTYPKCERKVYNELVEREINAYLPFEKVIRNWSDRKKQMLVPLFPNYVFVKALPRERARVLSIPGITRFISYDGEPANISDEEIDIMRLLDSGSWNVSKESFYNIGDRIRIIRGPLTGLEGMLIERKGTKRFSIRLASIKQAVSLEIQNSHFEKISCVRSIPVHEHI